MRVRRSSHRRGFRRGEDLPSLRALTRANANYSTNAFIGLDSPASGEHTSALLGWEPTGVGMLEDLEQGHYFRLPE